MGLLTYLVLLAVSGLIVGALARLALPGRDPLSIWPAPHRAPRRPYTVGRRRAT